MKHINKSLALAAVLPIMLAGCLKDNKFINSAIQSNQGANVPVVGMAANVSSTENFALVAYDNGNNDTTVDLLPISVGGTSPADKDLHITVEQVDQLVDNYNAANETEYTPPPVGSFTTSSTVLIKKGAYIGYLQIKFKPSNYIGQPYALGYRIKSIQETGYAISGNLDSAVCAIVIKNKYDGNYNLKMQSTGWGAYTIADGPTTYTWPSKVGFSSTGGNTLIFSTAEAANFQMGFTPTGGVASFGAATPQFAFDLGTNKLTGVTNLTPDSRNRAFKLNPEVTDSRYDPATKTIYIAYIMGQDGRPDMKIYDTLTYSGPR